MSSAEFARSGEITDAQLISALLAARDDAATRAFDDALQAAESAGTIDIDTARALRYWQRQSIEGLLEHAALVIPAALATRRASDIRARETAAEARASYEQARAIQRENSASPDGDSSTSDGEPTRRGTSVGLSVVPTDNSNGGTS